MKILLVEDDRQICRVTEKYFSDQGAEITSVQDGRAALELAEKGISGYSLVLLDIMLPGADGFTICRAIRKNSDIPVIFITAKGREEDILHGYALGCDDYIVKPFLLSALYAKCCAMVKRTEQADTVLTCGAITLDTKKLTSCVNGQEVELTPKGFAILYYMMEHEGWVIDRDTLLNKVWGDDYFGVDRVVDNHVKRLRKALGSAGAQIHTVFGRGYKLTEK
ncbi:response regulator transcription factor [Ruminococcus sp.]|uniref:response regulator transcription factor n=1 Tax=Ruminococcus sp. TaxID=41978 RepID=UPI0025E5D0A4|nr:response regulator transcription factor [Ruminococcus sp.]MBQ8966473.1 response regulator transcription factor [Ruminococcus sp.]